MTTVAPADARTLAPAASAAQVWSALVVVYLVWGSTYLGIRVLVEGGVPPLLGMGVRFLTAGLLLGLFVLARRGLRGLSVGWSELRGAGVMGVLLLLGGNGLVAVAEQTVPSGLTALLVATTPLWLVLFRAMTGDWPRRATALGTLVGLGGVALLALRGGGIPNVEAWGMWVVIAATLSWAVGSFLSPRLGLPGDAMVATTWEMLLGGVALVLSGLLAGERLDLAAVGTEGWVAWGYLVVVGSIAGYGAYVWLLGHAPISLVATYAFVNPVVAVLLGWLLLAEPITDVVLLGGAIVVLGVALVVSAERRR